VLDDGDRRVVVGAQALLDRRDVVVAAPARLAALQQALHEHVLGANPAVWMYAGGAGFAQIVWHIGTEEQNRLAVSLLQKFMAQ
jgi:hypothetical protein